MANTILTTEAMRKGIDAIFDEVYSNYNAGLSEYRLEQCGKLYRVKYMLGFSHEYKSGWLKLNEAQAIMKLLEVSEDGTS